MRLSETEAHGVKVGDRLTIDSAPAPFNTFTYEVTKIENGSVHLKIVEPKK